MIRTKFNIEKPKVISVKELLSISSLKIPEYQRPYKWTLKNVNQLLDDILFFNDKKAYRLGTLVLHKEKNVFNVVDGQQRTITLLLIALAIEQNKQTELTRLKTIYPKAEIESYKPITSILDWDFSNTITQYNIINNYREIERRIREIDSDTIRFFFDSCQLVQVILTDISEAFQFFDSQNARGKDLEPHDLLKAFHLREMIHLPEAEMKKSVGNWEAMVTDELASLFSNYLFRIRNWSKGRSARIFTKNEVDVFKGISPDANEIQPYARSFRIVHFYTDHYNLDYHRNIDLHKMDYPFQIDQAIMNGRRFFEMVGYYKCKVDELNLLPERAHKLGIEIDSLALKILHTIEEYEGRNRTGDKYVRNLFDCALIYYIDKFGYLNISKAIEKLFIWAYTLRLNLHSVQIASMDNHALYNNKVFETIREATSHKELINIKLDTVTENRSSKTDMIKDLFIELKYYNAK